MGIEHRIKEKQDDNFWKCPHCGCIEELATSLPKNIAIECSECEEKAIPHDHPATWEDFWRYCQSLKDV